MFSYMAIFNNICVRFIPFIIFIFGSGLVRYSPSSLVLFVLLICFGAFVVTCTLFSHVEACLSYQHGSIHYAM